MKSYGQIAYEAYCAKTNWKSLISGASLPCWNQLTPSIQEAWEAAASATIIQFKHREEIK